MPLGCPASVFSSAAGRVRFFPRPGWALSALLAATLAACGGSDGGDAPAPTPTPPPAPSTPPASPLPTPQPAEWPLPQVTGGQAALLAGSLQSDTKAACGRVDAADPLQSRFGTITHAMIVGADGTVYLTDRACWKDRDKVPDVVRKIAPDGRVSTVATGAFEERSGRLQSFIRPAGLALGADGALYVSDASRYGGVDQNGSCPGATSFTGHLPPSPGFSGGVWRVSPGDAPQALAGVVRRGCVRAAEEDDGTGADASFCSPGALAFDAQGRLNVIDHHRSTSGQTALRVLEPVSGAAAEDVAVRVRSRVRGDYGPHMVSDRSGRIYLADKGCGASPGQLIAADDLSVAATQVPNTTLLAIDSRGRVYSASSEARREGRMSVIYRSERMGGEFVPVATGVPELHALAVGPDDALYLKAAHAVIRIRFD